VVLLWWQRSLSTNIAVQRAQLQTPLERCRLAIRLTICFDQAEPRGARFSVASDVLPFPDLFLFTRPSSLLERYQDNNRRSRQAA
jgi:hypothetical protein